MKLQRENGKRLKTIMKKLKTNMKKTEKLYNENATVVV